MTTSRYLSGFQSLDGVLSFTLPEYSYEFEPEQDLRPSNIYIAGRDFPLDLYDGKVLPLGDANERANFIAINDSLTSLDSAVDSMRQVLYYGANGYLLSTGADGSVRRARGRIIAMPGLQLSDLPYALPTSIVWTRYSKWGVANVINTTSSAIVASGTTFVVNNPGNAYQDRLLITITPLSATGVTNPILTNVTTGHVLSTRRDLNATTQRIQLDTTIPQIGYSTDSGVSYADDFGNLNLPSAPYGILEFALKYGNNTLRLDCTGSVNVSVNVFGDSAYI